MGPKRSQTNMTDHSEPTKKSKSLSSTNSKGFEWVDFDQLVTRYNDFSTIGSVFTEVGEFRVKHGNSVRIDWHAMVSNTSSGISNAREYQMIWRHLAYKKPFLEKIEDGAEPLDDDSDLDIEPAFIKTEPATKSLSSTGSANNDHTNSNPGSDDKRVSPTRTEEAADSLALVMKSSEAKQAASPSTSLAAASEESRAPSPDQSLNPSSTPQAPLEQPATPGGDMANPAVAASYETDAKQVASPSTSLAAASEESRAPSPDQSLNLLSTPQAPSEQPATPGGDMADPGMATSHAALFSSFREAQARVALPQSTNFDTTHITSSVASNSASPPSTRIITPQDQLSQQTSTDPSQNNVQGASTTEEVDGGERGTGNESSSGTGNKSSSGSDTSSGTGNKSPSGSGNKSSGSDTPSGTGNKSSSGSDTSSGIGNKSSSGNDTSSGTGNKSSSGSGNNSSSGSDTSSGTGYKSSSGSGNDKSSGTGNKSSNEPGAADKSSSESGDADKSSSESKCE